MSAKPSLRCLAFGCNGLRVILILFSLISAVKIIATGQESGQVVECYMENIQEWDVNYEKRNLSGNGIKCNVQCFTNCTCTLDDVKVTSNCSNGNTSIAQVRYPPDTRYLNWNNSKLYRIRSNAFHKVAGTIQVLHLSNVSLQYLQPDAFKGLTVLYWIWLEQNLLTEIYVESFRELVNLEFLGLGNNLLHEPLIGAFNGLTNLKRLDLSNNIIHHLEPGVFQELSDLISLYLGYNSLYSIRKNQFSNLTNLNTLALTGNKISEIQVGAFDSLTNLKYLYLYGCKLYSITHHMFRGLTNLEYLLLDLNSLSNIEPNAFAKLINMEQLWLSYNKLNEIHVGAFTGLTTIQRLYLDYNIITYLAASVFGEMEELLVLYLSHNEMTSLPVDVFQNNTQLLVLELSHNAFHSLPPSIFINQIQLVNLELASNQIQFLTENMFENLWQLQLLNLSHNELSRINNGLFRHCLSLRTLVLTDNPLWFIEAHSFAVLNTTVNLFVTSPATCCFTSAQCKPRAPPSQYLSCNRLLPYNILRIALWFVCTCAIIGNVCVLYTKYKQQQQTGDKVQLFLITNLSISDFFMGVYLVILLSTDLYYTDYFPTYSETWRKSVLCRIAGSLSVLSSEASAFFITLLTLDRFIGVKYTFSTFRFGTKSVRLLVILSWLVALIISICSFVLSQNDSDIYAVSEVCVGLPISRKPMHALNETLRRPSSWSVPETFSEQVYTGSKAAMFFSIGIFTGLNLICFCVVGYCYLAIFIYVRQTTKKSGRSRRSNEEIRMAMKMSLIVLTDFGCWVPIGVLSILVQTGVFEVDPEAYAWIATFVLPINSSINPFLYTLASFLSNRIKEPKGQMGNAKRTKEEQISMNTRDVSK